MAKTDARPAPIAEAQRLIKAHRSACAQLCEAPSSVANADAADRALSVYVAGLEATLIEIRDMDWVEACLDPQWARRRAHAALARLGAEP